MQSNTEKPYPIAPNHSLSGAAYVEKGMPAFDRQWSSTDYKQALTVLQSLPDTTQLPRYKSAISGTVFERMVSRNNLSLYRQKTLSAALQLSMQGALLQDVSQVLLLYVNATSNKQLFDAEQVEVRRYILDICRETVESQAVVMSSTAKDDPILEAQKQGRETMRVGVATVIDGCLQVLTEREAYRASELIRLAQSLEETLPAMYAFLPAATQQEIPVRLQHMTEQESDAALKGRLMRLAAAVSKGR